MTSTIQSPSITLTDGSTLVTTASPQDPSSSPSHAKAPLIICFHGSGPTPIPTWTPLITLLTPHYYTILPNRTPTNPSPANHVSALHEYLAASHHRPPCILLAHSHGGTFAKQFLQLYPDDVVGMVLVETGKAPDPSPAAEPDRVSGKRGPRNVDLSPGALGSKPLIIIRGNSLLQRWRDLGVAEVDAAAAEAEVDTGSAAKPTTKEQTHHLAQQRIYLKAATKQDETLEKAQLGLSRNSREVYLPDCGHNVIRGRPDVVVEGVQWVMGEIARHGSEEVEGERTPAVKRSWAWTGLLRRILRGREY